MNNFSGDEQLKAWLTELATEIAKYLEELGYGA